LAYLAPVRVSGQPTVPLRDITSCVPQHLPSYPARTRSRFGYRENDEHIDINSDFRARSKEQH